MRAWKNAATQTRIRPTSRNSSAPNTNNQTYAMATYTINHGPTWRNKTNFSFVAVCLLVGFLKCKELTVIYYLIGQSGWPMFSSHFIAEFNYSMHEFSCTCPRHLVTSLPLPTPAGSKRVQYREHRSDFEQKRITFTAPWFKLILTHVKVE